MKFLVRSVGLRSWARKRLIGTGSVFSRSCVDLIDQTELSVPVPRRVGLDLVPIMQPWSTARIATLFQEAADRPSESTFQAARFARHRLSSFWISAPVDQLQEFYEGELGELQNLLYSGPLMNQGLANDEKMWVRKLNKLLDDPNEQPRRLNILLALFSYMQPDQNIIQDYVSILPNWAVSDYVKYCAPEFASDLNKPAGLLNPSLEEMPPLTTRRGEEAMEWFRDEETLRYMKTLINGYLDGGATQEVVEELSGLRSVLAQLWLDVEPSQQQTLSNSSVGQISKSLIKAGFGRSMMDEQDQLIRKQLVDQSKDFNQPNSAGILFAMLMYYPPEMVGFKSTDGLPEWFVNVLKNELN